MSRTEPILPGDILCLILGLLTRKDAIALSMISHATRTESLPFLFTSVTLRSERKLEETKTWEKDPLDLFSAIKSVSLYRYEGYDRETWISILEFLSKLPNLQCLKLHLAYRDNDQLERFLTSIEGAPLIDLKSDTIESPIEPTYNTGSRGLQTLRIEWQRNRTCKRDDDDILPDLSAFLLHFIVPAFRTLQEFTLSFGYSQHPKTLNLMLLKGAIGLQKLSLKVDDLDPADIEYLPHVVPNLQDLSLLLAGPPFKEPFIAFVAHFSKLTHLLIDMDLEAAADDCLDQDHDLAWYNRCLHRRCLAVQQLANACPTLVRIDWKQQPIDEEWNDMLHEFVVEDPKAQSAPSESRVVRAAWAWWMAKRYEDQHGGPLPPDLINLHPDRNIWDRWMVTNQPHQ
ncbi:hypothetical protein Hypma_001306 [Hypsizygus marmoreus]|uniref:F-box domain-containing protein n=1 Tax=Hypsizygus marmoreus TaxID=39966 RepID=A0A369K408_HYPMA|nr:hypothetical protein Hypma_001306 [Hypsizygus marmoreus]